MFSDLSRRQFLRRISFLIAGSAIVGSIPLIGNLFASKAQAQVVNEEVYKGRKYKIETKAFDETPRTVNEDSQVVETKFDAPVELFIDDQKVRMIRDKRTQKYRTPLLPFTQYNSPQELARKLIDLGVQVPSGEVNLDPNVD